VLTKGVAALKGKTAVVIGGGRGLGLALTQGLALQGASVMAVRRSEPATEAGPQGYWRLGGRVEMVQGNCADETWCREVLRPAVAAWQGLDILICNAAPPIRPLGLSLDEMTRLREFAHTAFGLVSVPLAAVLDLVVKRSGTVVLVSSSAVQSVPADWPHYIAAKAAAEALGRWAAARHPNVRFLIARPPRMLTDQMNTPAGREGAVPVEQVSSAILRWLSHPGDRVSLMETF
jgi:NAD(P)-dependent dehydrogenase (short-subunit alcohol dehydrogenase family)